MKSKLSGILLAGLNVGFIFWSASLFLGNWFTFPLPQFLLAIVGMAVVDVVLGMMTFPVQTG